MLLFLSFCRCRDIYDNYDTSLWIIIGCIQPSCEKIQFYSSALFFDWNVFCIILIENPRCNIGFIRLTFFFIVCKHKVKVVIRQSINIFFYLHEHEMYICVLYRSHFSKFNTKLSIVFMAIKLEKWWLSCNILS